MPDQRGAHSREITKGHEGTSESNGFVHHLECGDGFLSVDSYQNLPNYIYSINEVYCMSIIIQ